VFGEGEDAPTVKASDDRKVQSTSLGIAHYTSTLGSNKHIVHLDVEGEDGTGIPLEASTVSKVIGTTMRCVEWFKDKIAREPDEEKKRQSETEYCEKRKEQVGIAVPRLMYLMSDVILIVGTDPLQNAYHSDKCKILKAISAGNRIAAPALVVVINKASYADSMIHPKDAPKARPKTIKEATEAYLRAHDPSGAEALLQ